MVNKLKRLGKDVAIVAVGSIPVFGPINYSCEYVKRDNDYIARNKLPLKLAFALWRNRFAQYTSLATGVLDGGGIVSTMQLDLDAACWLFGIGAAVRGIAYGISTYKHRKENPNHDPRVFAIKYAFEAHRAAKQSRLESIANGQTA